MIKFFLTIPLALIALTQCSASNVDTMMEDYLWQNRLILVFSPSKESSAYKTQAKTLNTAQSDLKDRDIIRWDFIAQNSVSIDNHYKPHLGTDPFYKHYNVNLQDFTIILIGKDGNIKLRSQTPITAKTLNSTIDAMPMRIREINK